MESGRVAWILCSREEKEREGVVQIQRDKGSTELPWGSKQKIPRTDCRGKKKGGVAGNNPTRGTVRKNFEEEQKTQKKSTLGKISKRSRNEGKEISPA